MNKMSHFELTRRQLIQSAAAIAASALWFTADSMAELPPGILSVAADDAALQFTLRGSGTYRLLAFPIQADSTHPDGGIILWEGELSGQVPFTAPRVVANIDRLFFKFRLFESASGKPVGSQKFVQDVRQISSTPPSLTWPSSIKGISCPVDVKDLATLGVKHTHINLTASAIIHVDPAKREDAFSRIVDGERIWFNPGQIRTLDRSIRELSNAGINAVGVITNRLQVPGVLTHPKSDLQHAPNKMGAFNLTNDAGVRHFRGLIEFISDRYCRGDSQFGSVGGWIIGNEVQSHWQWHNMGPATLAEVTRQYADELRLAWLSVRNAKADVPVFSSFDHFWAMAMNKDSSRHVPGRALMDSLVSLIAREGNFPWHVAQHPYPENLFKPSFWNDKTATFANDSPRITFKNVEVLAAYLRRKEMLIDGKPRRLILSEQGLHAGDTPDSEKLQAAAYAMAYVRLREIHGVEAFILHRHVDAEHEGGLKLGIWPVTGTGAGKPKRPIWDVVRAADTPQWQSAIQFALPVIGILDWSQAKPLTGPFPEQTTVIRK